MKKTGRNDPCPCGSGKKFKKCCESKMLGGRFMASKIEDTTVAPPKKITNLTGLFQSRVSEIAQPSEATRKLKPPAPPEDPTPEVPPENPNKEIEP